MKRLYFIFLLIITGTIANAQTGPGIMFRDSIYANCLIEPAVVYGSNANYLDSSEILDMTIYEPETAPAIKRPLIIFIHGGGLTSGSQINVAFLCAHFAARGYVTATINYRLGVPYKGDSIQFAQAAYLATQDANAAERYLKANADAYCIDTNFIFMGGTSAGCLTALNAMWLKQNEVPSYIDTAKFGTLNHADNAINLPVRVKGVINCWGAVTDSNIINNNPTVAVISFVGDSDKTIPPYDGYFVSNDSEVDVFLYGSIFIDKKLQQIGAAHRLKIFDGVGHGFADDDIRWDTVVNMSCNFLYNNFFQNYKPPVCRSKNPVIVTPAIVTGENEIQIQNNTGVIITETQIYNLWGQCLLTVLEPVLPFQTLTEYTSKWVNGFYIANFTLSNGTNQVQQFVVVNH